MPWRELSPMDEKVRFIEAFRSGVFRFAELCAFFVISRQTGDKWVGRWKEQGRAGLEDRSHAVRCCPHGMREDGAAVPLANPREAPGWGAAELVKRHGLVKPRRRRPHPGHSGLGQTAMSHPNSVWTADFKGQFKTLDGKDCYPFTLADGFSRYCLACVGL